MPLKVERVADEYDTLTRYLMREPVANALSLYDLRFERDRTEFFVCENDDGIQAHLANFRYSLGYYCALRGMPEATSLLVNLLPKSRNVVVNAEPSCQYLFEKGIESKCELEMEYLMAVKKGEERRPTEIAEHPSKLPPEFAGAWSRIYYEGEITGETIAEAARTMSEGSVYGIVAKNGKLASVASVAAKLPFVWVIVGVYTIPEYRRKGFASSVTFVASEDGVNNSGCSALYVGEDNYDALRIYEKMGYSKIGKSLKARMQFI
jgi:ribosomal protein S18 acetylase RimI-like enzyme